MGLPDDDTVIRVRAPRATPPDVADDDTFDGDTIVSGRRDRTPTPSAPAPQRPPHVEHVPATPSPFRLQVNRSVPVPLTAPVVLGRKPSPPRVPGLPAPRLVAVESPNHEVSGSHLEVRQQGTIVVVTDLRSTNGSVVVPPGRPPVSLRQGDSLVVVAGTVVDLGDGNTIEILPAERLPAAAPVERPTS